MSQIDHIKKEFKRKKNPKKAEVLKRFFKTGKGEYGEGDIFYGLTVPETRSIVNKFSPISLGEVEKLIKSQVHEERLSAVFFLVKLFEKGKFQERKKIYEFYLKNTKNINNWDLIDSSADKIVGRHLKGKSLKILFKLAKSKSLWERRISIISTFEFIRDGNFKPTLSIAKILLKDDHDLIHKATGWMLREVGNRSQKEEEKFLDLYGKKMPRTMLRYAIEKFEEKKRKKYLNNR